MILQRLGSVGELVGTVAPAVPPEVAFVVLSIAAVNRLCLTPRIAGERGSFEARGAAASSAQQPRQGGGRCVGHRYCCKSGNGGAGIESVSAALRQPAAR
jgi:hypothetical protein